MDILFLAAGIALWLAILGLVAGCDRLGARP
jgi:hypothetical protein